MLLSFRVICYTALWWQEVANTANMAEITHEFKQTLGDSGGQGNLACCSPQGRKESDTT